ncbi:hypothetical protein L3X38_041908 [Prunus dulcis]|uniref:Uncharacterized protein n=1 Tax=Prunus dulcis TaxID=3755 RepID=A0AAD4UTX5_PRUDU|nr:hypothetical protein L3X38_041908 [Prunus dulcis]
MPCKLLSMQSPFFTLFHKEPNLTLLKSQASSSQSSSLDLIVDLPAPPVNSHPLQTLFKSRIIQSRHGFLAAKTTTGPSPLHEPQTYSRLPRFQNGLKLW